MCEAFTVTPLRNQSNPPTPRAEYADYQPTDWVTSFLDPEDDGPLKLVIRGSSSREAAETAFLIGNHQGHDDEGTPWPYDTRAVGIGDVLQVLAQDGRTQCFTGRRSSRLTRLAEAPLMSRSVPATHPAADFAQILLNRIAATPRHFDQTRWFSGAEALPPGDALSEDVRMCAAGWAAHLAGYAHSRRIAWRRLVERQGLLFNVESVAAAALGLVPDDAKRLFDSNLNPAIARAALTQIAAGVSHIDWVVAGKSHTFSR
ncbi:hypothetical protein [Streptomyces sp. S1D4-20]|uniref:hypothetical protein n=1 Tax=Streptomyces sp. S1D4-20 TaxID=2594462 RepID=UPI001163E038|nr:hypothetical protein [Streptomyces sp. S1D4-20]QDN54278.1 hypothetical protein FNV67_01575 [Streptomyces sp. S1D4-20]